MILESDRQRRQSEPHLSASLASSELLSLLNDAFSPPMTVGVSLSHKHEKGR